MISAVVKDLVEKWLRDFVGDNATDFDLISTPFQANGLGFDRVLDASSVNAGNGTVTIRDNPSAPTVTQVSTLTYDPINQQVSVNTSTTAANGVTSSSVVSSLVPVTSLVQAALNGINDTFSMLAQIVNSKGANLSDADLVGLFDSGYLEAGFGADYGSAIIAQDLRGAHLNSMGVERILSYNETERVIEVVGTFSFTMNGQNMTKVGSGSSTGSGTYFRQQVDASWRFYGDQRPASVLLLIGMGTHANNVGSGLRTNVDVQAPVGIFQSMSVSGGGLFLDTPLNKSGKVQIQTIAASPSRSLQIEHDSFETGVDVGIPPPAGTEFTVTLTPVTGPPRSFKIVSTGATNESITLTSPSGHSLADARLGEALTVSWSPPKTLAIADLELRGAVDNANFRCEVKSAGLGPGVASSVGTITLPTTCGSQPVTGAEVGLTVYGPHGERMEYIHFFS